MTFKSSFVALSAIVLLSPLAAVAEPPNYSQAQQFADPFQFLQRDVYEYDVQVAEPVPEVEYVVEYLEQGSDQWRVFAVSDSAEDAQDDVVWVLLHLIAEARIVEREPRPDWETIDTFSKYSEAEALADQIENDGLLLVRIVSRKIHSGVMLDIDRGQFEQFNEGPLFATPKLSTPKFATPKRSPPKFYKP